MAKTTCYLLHNTTATNNKKTNSEQEKDEEKQPPPHTQPDKTVSRFWKKMLSTAAAAERTYTNSLKTQIHLSRHYHDDDVFLLSLWKEEEVVSTAVLWKVGRSPPWCRSLVLSVLSVLYIATTRQAPLLVPSSREINEDGKLKKIIINAAAACGFCGAYSNSSIIISYHNNTRFAYNK